MQNLYAEVTQKQTRVFKHIRANVMNDMYIRDIELRHIACAYEFNDGKITTAVTEFKGGEI